jgi:hypothetical protein
MTKAQFPMTKFVPIPSIRFRRLRSGLAAAVLALGIGHWTLVLAAPEGSAPVVAVRSARVADLVLLGGGFEAGLREGMVCRVTRGATVIAEIELVGLRARAGAALILNLTPGQSIQPGDLASVKVSKT